MRKMSHDEIAARRLPESGLAEAPRMPVVVLVDSVRSLYNVGSIFRTSDGAFIEELILTGFSPYPPRKEIDKTALGATKSIPWRYFKDPLAAVAELRERNYRIAALELTDASRPYSQVTKQDFPLCLIVGNEITGISKDLLAACDLALEIPMHGTKQSLNVAVAYGIAIFELGRIWRS